ncbi:MAG: hypothetical protein LBK06_04150, partial [Planctomycetaceae bacterium]|nr:hypothetical protein [Planctomycetaceae bacterium]
MIINDCYGILDKMGTIDKRGHKNFPIFFDFYQHNDCKREVLNNLFFKTENTEFAEKGEEENAKH